MKELLKREGVKIIKWYSSGDPSAHLPSLSPAHPGSGSFDCNKTAKHKNPDRRRVGRCWSLGTNALRLLCTYRREVYESRNGIPE